MLVNLKEQYKSTVLQFFLSVCPIFSSTLAFLDMFWVHVIHVLDMFQVLRGM